MQDTLFDSKLEVTSVSNLQMLSEQLRVKLMLGCIFELNSF